MCIIYLPSAVNGNIIVYTLDLHFLTFIKIYINSNYKVCYDMNFHPRNINGIIKVLIT